MTASDPHRHDAPSGPTRPGLYTAMRERVRRERDVVTSVRNHRHGKTTTQLADELRHGFAVAGVPQPPETVQLHATLIAGYPWSLLTVAGRALTVVRTRTVPAGTRSQHRTLPSDDWIEADIPNDASTQVILRHFHRLHQILGMGEDGMAQDASDEPTPLPVLARLITTPATDGTDRRQVAVLLGGTYVGTVPADHTDALTPWIDQADAADQRLMAQARTQPPRAPTGPHVLFIAVPRPPHPAPPDTPTV